MIVKIERFSLVLKNMFFSLLCQLLDSRLELFLLLVRLLRVNRSNEFVVLLVDHELDRVRVLLEKGCVLVGQVCESSADVPCVFDGAFVPVGSVPKFFEVEDGKVFEHFVSHHKLFA